MSNAQHLLLEIGELESMAHSAALAMTHVPEVFFEDELLAGALLEPLRQKARSLLAPWICRVTPTYYLGCNVIGEHDQVNASWGDVFVGRFTDVDIFSTDVDAQLGNGISGGLIPSLVFETLDEPMYDAGLAQTYLHVAVPLVGTVTTIQTAAFANTNPS